MQRRFVFHDPSGKRWTRVRRALGTLALLVAMLIVLLGVAALSSPQLPRLGLPEVQHVASLSEMRKIIRGEKLEKNIPFTLRKAAKEANYVPNASPVLHPHRAVRVTSERPIVVGFYVNWDRASMVSLRMNARHLTHLAPEWLLLKNAAGDLEDSSDNTVIEIARQADLPVLAMLTNYRAGWQGGDLHKLLASKAARENLVDNLYSNIMEHKFAGVMLDLEQARPHDKARMVQLVAEVRAKLKPAGLIVAQSVPSDDPAYDMKRLAELNDFIVPMLYDEHFQSGSPGPVASQDWFEKQLDRISDVAPPEKMVVGIGSYGYDWVIGSEGGSEVSFNDVMAAGVANHASVVWDTETDNPVLRYSHNGEQHEVWFLDAVTGLNHTLEAFDRGFRGIGVWRLGAEDPEVWKVLDRGSWPKRAFDVSGLLTMSVQQSVNQYGEGEIIRVAETPREGRRRVWQDEDSSYSEEYETLPTYFVLESYGHSPEKRMALTFDDGPDEEFTPPILDILKGKNVKATFFVVGSNAEAQQDLLRRMYAEGNEIGNHTYSHPNIAIASGERLRLELDATQRIIEHAIGRSTILFRPPYNADSEPETPEEIEPIRRAQDLGYLTVGERIDPQDWRKESTPEGIMKEIMEEHDNGNIVLLHDSGGDRTATVKALPAIIDYFHKKGYQFVTVGGLLGKTREQTMPLPPDKEQGWAMVEGQALDLKGLVQWLMGLVFVSAIVLTALRSAIFAVMAVWQKQRAATREFDAAYQPPVSVVIAAFNEASVICRTVQSVLSSDYSDIEVVVVNDGSNDATLEVLRGAFEGNSRVKILSQENAGKSAALNRAIAAASHEVLVAVDADTLFRPDTITKLVRHFNDDSVGAVSGNAKVGNKHNWITRFQSIEYIYGFNLDRRALDLVNAITVVPGAVGAWRKSLVQELGGFGHDTLAEDTDLTLAIRRSGYQIRYEEAAVAFTEAPEDVRSLAKQRFRWAFGTLQAVWKHRDATFSPSAGTLGFVALPSIWLFQVVLAGIAPFADLAMIATLFAGNWPAVLGYYLAFFWLELMSGLLAYWLEGESPRDLLLLFPQRLFYRQLMHYVLLRSLLYAARGRLVGWGKLERKATVTGT